MKFLRMPLQLLWRIWFYLLVFVTLLILFPFLLILTAKEKYYAGFWWLIRKWSYIIVYGVGFRLRIEREQELESNKSYMFCPNHTSIIDGFVLAIVSKNPIVFVGKKELSKLPIFGFFYKKVVIMVDRSDVESRKKVYEQAKNKLKNGSSIAIFPEGLVPTENIILSPFKNGAFNLSIEHQIPIVPHIYFDCKRLFSWNFFKGYPGVLRVKQKKFINTENLTIEDKDGLKEKTYDLMHSELNNDKLYMKDTNRPDNNQEFNSMI